MIKKEECEPGTRVTHLVSGVSANIKSYSPVTETLVVQDNAGVMIWRRENVQKAEVLANAS